ncbi:AAA family ATPase [Halomonas sp. ML-15]|uniref:DEAD/DEAH box helicase n=1 Tax=Halomonas sp. ML-15 TaxID=2773305 RepID=UPI001745D1B1|nr:AAA domain-containing protein [Halomonas sp. ML-15]MBD3894701.1 AAA family ATPase [Halomonas sp. ML-15]
MNDNDVRRLIAYFRDCLMEEGGERQLTDVFGRESWEHYLFACPGGWWEQDAPLSLPREHAERLSAMLHLHRQERELLVGTCLVMGPVREPGGTTRHLRAPLFLHSAELLDHEGQVIVHLEPGAWRVNPAVLQSLDLSEEELGITGGEVDVASLQRALGRFERCEHGETSQAFPRWRNGQPLRWAPSGVVWITARSQLARSVAYELEALSDAGSTLSPPIRQLLQASSQSRKPASAPPVPETLPTSLTLAQERALHNAAVETLSVINGPPGTGKTYTLACQAIDRVMRNERVLVVCSNEHAADVVRTKLAELFGPAQGLVVRAGRGNHRQQLLERLDELLAEASNKDEHESPPRLASRLQAMARDYRRSERRFRKALVAAVDEGALWRRRGGLWHGLRLWWLRRRAGRRDLLSQRWGELQSKVSAHQALARSYLAALAHHQRRTLQSTRRQQLRKLATALRSRASGRREARFEALDWSVLTRAFPVWVVSAQALHRTLPLESELFDLCIMDEATQSNLPLALPALQRASRAVIVGDPRQLRHFSFLSQARQHEFAVRHQVQSLPVDLNYRERSLLDYGLMAIAGGHAIVLLDEHFRSHPALIGFSNDRFYAGRLKILTHLAQVVDAPPIALVDCPVRIEGDVNAAEIEAVMEHLEALAAESADLPDHECQSIGVLALFRATALALEKALLDRVDLRTISRHDLRVGTPYAFQGEERDIMLLATGVYPGRAAAAWTYLNRPDVFNVAVTRARHRQVVFMPQEALEGVGSNLLVDYVAYARTNRPRPMTSPPAHDGMRTELIAILEAWGARCRIDYPFAGQTLDILVLYQGHALAVDTIGTDATAGKAWDWERYRLLERAGLAIFPIGYVSWRTRREEVLECLRTMLGMEAAIADDEAASASLSLRWRLQELSEPDMLVLLDELDQAYHQILRWLDRHFDPGELTYLRYRDGVERLRRAAITELQGACMLLEGIRDLAAEVEDIGLRSSVDERLARCREAITGLQHLIRELAVLRTQPSGIEAALEDVTRLSARVQRYGVDAPQASKLVPPAGHEGR